MTKVRWGLLSTAHINRRVIPAIRASHRSDLVAVASRDQERATSYALEWQIPKAFSSYETMLSSGEIDAVYVSLPNHLHAKWSIQALQGGVHVLCEKPLALSVSEVDQMIAASQSTGRLLAEAFMYRHHPQTKIAGELAHTGRLGEVTLVRGVFNFAIRDRKSNIRLVPEYGGGSLWDVGVYPMSFAQFIFGSPPDRVRGEQRIGESGVDEVFTGLLRYPEGGLALIASSLRTPFYTSAEIIATQGRLSIDLPFVWSNEKPRMVFYSENGTPEEIQVPQKELYLGEIEDMNAAILDGAPNYLSLQESWDHIHTITSLYSAAERNQVVYLE
jgi:xylose dehydrogenase (NAD/NADP)